MLSILDVLLVVLIVLWLTGAAAMPFAGSAIHTLLVVIVIVILIRLLQGRAV